MLVTVLSVLAALAAGAGAIKALPVIWSAAKDLGRLIDSWGKTTAIPELLENQQAMIQATEATSVKLDDAIEGINSLSNALKDHMIEEEHLREDERNMVKALVDQIDKLSQDVNSNSIKIANTVFRQAVFADPIAYYTIEKANSGEWDWTWGNKAYFDLTGLTDDRARAGHYWDIVRKDQQEWVKDAAKRAALEGSPLELEITLCNVMTNRALEVQVLAWPVHDNDGDAVVYLGAIRPA